MKISNWGKILPIVTFFSDDDNTNENHNKLQHGQLYWKTGKMGSGLPEINTKKMEENYEISENNEN